MRVFQFQDLAEPVSTAAPAAPVVSWQPQKPDQTFRAATLTGAVLAGALFFVAPVAAPAPAQPLVAAPDFLRVPLSRPWLESLPSAPRVTVTPPVTLGAASFGPDYLRSPVGRAQMEPPSLFTNAAPFPERVTADRWQPVRPDWLRVPSPRPHIEPSPVGLRLLPPAPVTGSAIYPDWLRVSLVRPHLEPQSVLGRTAFAEATSVDRWLGYRPDWLRVPRSRPEQEPASAFGWPGPYAEKITLDKWHPNYPDWLRVPVACPRPYGFDVFAPSAFVLFGPHLFIGEQTEANRLTGEPEADRLTGESEATRA